MLLDFVQFGPDLARACADSTVLTSTDRLRRNLMRAFGRYQQQSGQAAWITPRVSSLDNYLAEQHRRLRLEDPRLPRLLGPQAEFQLFHATAVGGAERLVPLAREAWRLCHQWLVPTSDGAFAATENGRLFRDWADRVRRRLDLEGAVTHAELASLGGLDAGDTSLACLAFEQQPRAASAWLDRQQAAGVAVRHLAERSELTGRQAEPQRFVFDTPEQELAAAADWARQLLVESDGSLCIGVVVPDLARRYDAVLRQWVATFDPLLEGRLDGVVDVGSGKALSTTPIWRAAASWLRLCFEGLPSDAVAGCFSDPYLNLPGIDPLPDQLPEFLDLQRLAEVLPSPRLASLRAGLPQPTARTSAEWVACFGEVLDQAGWDGARAGSHQYQAYRACRTSLEALARTSGDRPVGPAAALQLLEDYLASALHAPERPAAPVQVMGYLETTGLSFSHLSVTGLDDESWPQPLRLNPLIPAAVRHRYGLPRSTPEAELEFARQRLAHWRGSAHRLVLSHARQSGETVRGASPLTRQIPAGAAPTGLAHPLFQHRPGWMERIEDRAGSPLAGAALKGGTGRLRDQAQCPFRGFAVHRLDLEARREPHALPDALDRGILIHDALHRLYEDARATHRTAADLGPGEFRDAAAAAIGDLYRRFPAAFRVREQDRLVRLLAAWNQLEASRPEVSMEALEQELSVTFDDVGLRLRVDRIDRIGDALVVIDYKSGRVGSLAGQDRLVEPQLPVYALCDRRIQGVLFAEVDESRPRLKGLAAIPVEQAALLDPPESWPRQLARWESQLRVLIEEIRRGHATVTPFHPRACSSCHLKSVCRFHLSDPNGSQEAPW